VTERQGPNPNEIIKMTSYFLTHLPQIVQKQTKIFVTDYWKGFQAVYQTSGIDTYLDDYIAKAIKLTLISSLIFAIIPIPILVIPFKMNLFQVILGSLATALIGSSLVGAIQIIYPYYKRGEAKGRLEDGLIYFLSYMSVLSASGMPIEKMLESITDVEDNPPLVHLTKKFIINVRLFGMDVRSALKDIAEMSPSKIFGKQMESVRTAIATSGDLKTLLTYEVDRQLQSKKEKMKARLNSLVYIGELYVAMMVITPTLFILVIAILSVLGGNAVGGSAVTQLNLIVFVGIPIMGAIFIIFLDQTLGREE
jgi:archaeal flagellar protein FlaJ